MRDPVERAYSAYWLVVRNGKEDRPFAEAVRDELGAPGPGRLLRSSLYADNVSRYLETFPGAVHVVFLEQLAWDPRGEMRRIFDFLGVDAAVAHRLNARVHNAQAVPRGRLAAIVHNSRRVRAVAWRAAPPELRLRLQRLLLKRPPRGAMESGMEALLTEFFAPDVERLRTLLGGDLPWPRFSRSGDSGPLSSRSPLEQHQGIS